MADNLRLQVIFSALDKLTGPLKKIHGESSTTAKALKATSDRLKELNNQQKQIGQFRDLHKGLSSTSTRLQEAQKHVNALAQKLKQTESPTKAMTREFNAASKAAGDLKSKNQQQSQQLQVLRDRLSTTGISTRNLATHERNLRTEISATNSKMGEQQRRLEAVAARQKRVANAQGHASRARAVAGNLAVAGAGATVAGAVMGAPVVKSLSESKHYESEIARIRALGLGDGESNKAIAFAKEMKTYGTSQLDNLTLVRDAMSVFADEHHAEMVAPTLAKMKFANHAAFGAEKSADNERMFMDMLKVIELRGGLASKEEFIRQANIVQQVISATGGRVGPNEWLNVIKTGGIAAKGIKDEAFYYQLEPLVQEMGGFRVGTSMMSAYQNLYQGRTSKRAALKLQEFGLIGDQSKVKHDKAGQISYLNPGAIKNSELFRSNQFEWMEKVLLPQLAQKGITERNQILDSIGSIFTNKNASNLFSQMYIQREQIHKNSRLNAGAANIDQLYDLSKDTASGKELDTTAKLADLKLVMGEKILPIYSEALDKATVAFKGLNKFMEENPTTAKVIILAFSLIAGILVVLGPLMLALAALIGPYAMLHVMFAKMGITGGVLTPILKGIGQAFLGLGRAMLMNPIGLIITGIAIAAFLVYKYWDPIKTFFKGLWTEIKAAFSGGILGVGALIINWSPLGLFYKAFAGVMKWFGIELPDKFTEFGANIMDGLVNGITSKIDIVLEKIKSFGAKIAETFQASQGIHSPSRLFASFGEYITQGLAIGLTRGEDEPITQVNTLGKRLAQIGAGIVISTAALPAMAFDTRPPLSSAGSQAVYQSNDTIQIIIQPVAGMDPQSIARAVAAELDKRDREKSARKRSSLHDY